MRVEKEPFLLGILSFNHPEITQKAIESCLECVSSRNIVLLHNGSEDRWVKRLQEIFPDIQHLILKDNGGFTGGINALLEFCLSHSSWCLFLTNDVQLLKCSRPPHPGLWTPRIFRRQRNKIDSLGALFFYRRGHLEHCRHESYFLNPPKHSRPYVPGTAFWLDRETFQGAGLFDKSLGTYWEDVDYSQKVMQSGGHLGFAGETELLHRVGKTCHKKPLYTLYLFHRNRYIVTMRYLDSLFLKGLFFVRYWSQWFFSFVRSTEEGRQWKMKILKDLWRNFY